jgi:CheY-like chemotaxis protein
MAMPHSVLVADDDESMRHIIADILTEAGNTVACATDGADAIHQLGGPAPDLMILDLLMPGTSGWDVLEFMEERPRLSTIPVVVLTAYGSSGEIPTGRPVIHKPVDPDLLLQLVEELLSQGDDARKFGAQEGPSDLLPRSRRGLPPRPT